MKTIIFAFLMVACTNTVTIENQYDVDLVQLDEVKDTIRFNVPDRVELVQVTLDRWNSAACLDLEISATGQHDIIFTNEGFSTDKRAGQITSKNDLGWESTTIRIRKESNRILDNGKVINRFPDAKKIPMIMHELAHLLRQKNDHLENSVSSEAPWRVKNNVISEELLIEVCEINFCRCFNPETIK